MNRTSLKSVLRMAMAAFIVIPVILSAVVGLIAFTSYSKKLTVDEAGAAGLSRVAGISAAVNEYANFAVSASKTVSDPNSIDGTPIPAYAAGDANIVDIVIVKTGDTGNTITATSNGINFGEQFYGELNPGVSVSGIQNSNSNYDGKSTFYCSAPIEGTDSYIVVIADVKVFDDYLSASPLMKGKGTLAVFDAEGNAVNAGRNDSGILKSRIDTYKGKTLSLSGGAYEKFENGGYYGSVGDISGTKWRWIAVYPSSSPTPSPFNILAVALSAAAIVVLLDVLIMIFGTRSLIGPLTKTIEKMRVIKEGAFQERLDVTGKNEFAQMAETFNIMLGEVVFSEDLHRTVSDISDNMLFEWDFVKETMFVSDNFKEVFGDPEPGVKLMNGKFIESKMDEENADKYRRDINRLLKTKETIGSEYEITTKNGSTMWVSLRAHCITDRVGELVRVLGVLTNIDSEKKLNLQLMEKASFDFLSGLYNRNTFEKELDETLSLSANKKLAILFVDIDDFKFINDRFNHTIGDVAIKFTASKLKAVTEKGGLAGRFGGDEFVLCLTDPDQIENVEQLCIDIIDELYEGYFCEQSNTQMNIRVSIGVSLCPQHSSNGKTLIAQADEAMYFVKKNGKSNYHFYDPEDSNITDMFHH